MTGAELKGMDDILRKLEQKFGAAKVTRAVNKTLNSAGDDTQKKVTQAVSAFRDTGATTAQVTRTNARKIMEVPTVKIGWGQGTRWRLEHLNEFGYNRHGQFIRPRGFGVLQSVIDSEKVEYPSRIRKGLKENLK